MLSDITSIDTSSPLLSTTRSSFIPTRGNNDAASNITSARSREEEEQQQFVQVLGKIVY